LPANSSQRKLEFVSKLLHWGDQNRRDFRWRHTQDPYNVLVAELLVQRTKAVQVEPVYLKFLERWSNVGSLSRAKEQEIRSVVGTLGLDYRAKRIQTIARRIMELFGGKIPDEPVELRRLYGKGFGDYMANAILCFAFGQDVPVVDKNVERILKRVFSVDVRNDGHRDKRLWTFAAGLVPKHKAKEYNWSLLDFGALLCTARNPKCSVCPMRGICDYVKNSLPNPI